MPARGALHWRVGAWHPHARGALWITAAALVFALSAGVAKLLSQRLPVAELVCLSTALSLPLLAPLVWRHGARPVLLTRRWPLHLARAVVGGGGFACGLYAVVHLPVAQAIAISFARPLFTIPLAVLFLGEVVRLRRWAATLIGFCGVLIVMRPDPSDLQPAVFVALLGALLAAEVSVLVKKLAATEGPLTILVFFNVVTAMAALLPALWVWTPPRFDDWGLLVLMAVLNLLGQFCTIRGLAVGEATVVAPFDYSRLLFAAAVGFALFGEVPSVWTYVGSMVAAGSAVYIVRREQQLRARGQG